MPTPEEASETNSSRLGSSRYNLRNRDSIPTLGAEEVAFSQPRQPTSRTRRTNSRGTGSGAGRTKSSIDTGDAAPERRANVDSGLTASRVTTSRTTHRVHSACTERPLKVGVLVDDELARRVSTRRKPRPVSAAGISSGPASATRSGRASKRESGQQKEHAEQSEHRVHGEGSPLRRPMSVRVRKIKIPTDHTQHLTHVNPGTLPVSASDSESRMTDAENTLENMDRWRKADLLYECRRRKLNMTGTKKELRQRIQADIHQERELPGAETGQPDGVKEETMPVRITAEGVRTRGRSQRAQHSAAGTVPSRTEPANDVAAGSVNGDDDAVAAQPEEDVRKEEIENGDRKITVLSGKGDIRGEEKFITDKPGEQAVVCRKGDRHDDRDEGMGDLDASGGDVQDGEEDWDERNKRTACTSDRKQIIGGSRRLADDKIAHKKSEGRGDAADVQGACMHEKSHLEDMNVGVDPGAQRSWSIAQGTGDAEQVQVDEDVITAVAVLDGMDKGSSVMPGTLAAIKEDSVERKTGELDGSGTSRAALGRDASAGEIRVACDGVPGEDEKVGIETDVHPKPLMLPTQNLPSTRSRWSDSRNAQVGTVPDETLAQAVQQDSSGNDNFRSETIDSKAPIEGNREKPLRSGYIREVQKGKGSPSLAVSQENDFEINKPKSCEPMAPSSGVCENNNEHVRSTHDVAKEPSTGHDDFENDPGDVLQSHRAVAHEEIYQSIDAVAPNGTIIKEAEWARDQGYGDGASSIPRNAVVPSGEMDARDCAHDLTNRDICALPGNGGGLDRDPGRNVQGSQLPDSDEPCERPSKSQQEAVNATRKAEDSVIGSAEAKEIAHGTSNEVKVMTTGDVALEIASTERGSLDRSQSAKDSAPSQGTNQEQVSPGTEGERCLSSGSRPTLCHVNVPAADTSPVVRSHSAPGQSDECFDESSASGLDELAVGGSVANPGVNNSGLLDGAITFSESPLPSPRPFDLRDADVNILSPANFVVDRHLESEIMSQLPLVADAPKEIDSGRHGVDALQFTEAEPRYPVEGLGFSGTGTGAAISGRIEICSSGHLNVTEPPLPKCFQEEGIHLNGIQSMDLETLDIRKQNADQEIGEAEQMAQDHAHPEAAVGNSLPSDINMASEHVAAASYAQGAQNLHMQGGSSADELSSDDNEEPVELSGEESGGNGDPVDDVVANGDSSPAEDEDLHSGDSRSSQGSNPDAAGSDRLSPGGSWSSGQPSCPSPRSGASSGQQDDEGNDYDVIAAHVVDGPATSETSDDEVVCLSSEDGDIPVPAHPDSDGTGAAEVGADGPELSDSAQECKGLAADRHDISGMRSGVPGVAHEAKLERDVRDVSEPKVAEMINLNHACTGQEDWRAVRRGDAAGVSVDSAGVARDISRTLRPHTATGTTPDESAFVLVSRAALADVHGEVPESLHYEVKLFWTY